jgi:preprotein translocase subunit SecF
MQIFHNPNYNFLRWRWHALILSWVIIAAGLGVILTKGLALGVEFSGGTIVILEFEQTPSIDLIRSALDAEKVGGGGQNIVVQRYGAEAENRVMVRLPHTGVEQGTGLTKTKDEVVKALTDAKIGKFRDGGTQVVGPVVGKELTQKGIWATVFSLAGLLIYIGFRFKLSFGVGAVVATFHDLLVTLAFLAFFQYDMSLNVIAAILTVTGYSTNDTIVIFDRVRENMRGMRRDNINDIVNASVNQTLGRTVITAGTVLMSVIALYLFGGEVLKGFAFTMIVGTITGTYSSVFIAAAIVTFWRRKQPARVPSAAPASSDSARKKNGKKDRA